MFIKEAFAQQNPLDALYPASLPLGGSNAQLSKLINPLIANVFIVSGIVAFFVILFAGFSYISGAGDKNKMAQSTNMLTYAILGLVVVVSAFLVTRILGSILGFTFF